MSSDEDDELVGEGGDDNVSLPRASVFKAIKEMLPKDLRCANETRELILTCCTEFVQLIASEANEVCDKEGRKTIGAEHVIASLKNLGFEHYIEEARSVLEDHLEDKKKRQKLGQKMAQSGLSREELLAQQRALFQQARMRTNSVQAPPQQQDQDPNPQPPGAGAPAPAPAMRRRSDDDDDDYD